MNKHYLAWKDKEIIVGEVSSTEDVIVAKLPLTEEGLQQAAKYDVPPEDVEYIRSIL